MADVKKISGFQAPDGTIHNTLTAAVAHAKQVKMRAAVMDLLEGTSNPPWDDPLPLGDWLLANRAAVLAALNPEVRLRAAPENPKPRKRAFPAPQPVDDLSVQAPAPAKAAA